ncbi:hypothetical protein G6514_001632 [Epicoccum nigrum]|nr:hypothetical protein G6514_001632 [Epicoccum nigrum]
MAIPDNGPVIVGVTWWLTFFSGGFLGLRIYAKVTRRQGLWWDDWILIASWGFLLIEAILTQVGQALGFGKPLLYVDPKNLLTISFGTSLSITISCFASTLSKISFGVTLLRLTADKIRWSVWFCIVTLFLVMLPSAFITYIQCTPTAKAWNPTLEGHCWDIVAVTNYGIFNAAWCTAADIYLALLPWNVLWGLQMRMHEKIGVGIAMSMGILAGLCAIIKGIYIQQIRETDFSYNGKDVIIWTAVETAVAIIGASLPVLRVFLREKVSSYNSSRGHRSGTTNSTLKPTPGASRGSISGARRSIALGAINPNKDGAWTRIEPIDECAGEGRSERGYSRRGSDEESGIAAGGRDGSQDGIWQTTVITHKVESAESKRNLRGQTWAD